MRHRSNSSDLPEVVPSENYGALQIVYDGIEHHPETAHNTATSKDTKHWEKSYLKALQFAWWRRRLWLLVALGTLVVCSIVGAIAAGVIVSRGRGNSTESELSPTTSPSSTHTTATSTFAFGSPTMIPESLPPSTCLGSMCPQMLSVSSLAKGSVAFLFGRGADQAIWYRQAEGEKWTTKWTSLGGAFVSSPTSLSIREGRIDVFAVDESQGVQFKSFQNGEWPDEWTTLYGSCSSQPSSTTFGIDKLSLVCVNADHRLQLKYYKGRWGPSISDWEDLGSGWLSSTPALDSGSQDQVHIVAYGIAGAKIKNRQDVDYSMIYKRYNTTDWQDWEGGWGSFKGDPAIVAVAKNQVEYFGVDKDGAMWHNAWLAEKVVSPSTRRGTNLANLPPEYTDPEKLGGNFTSAPFAFATGNSRIDVLAVGIDGRLKHQARIGKTWAQDWEDLGGYFESAPLALTLGYLAWYLVMLCFVLGLRDRRLASGCSGSFLKKTLDNLVQDSNVSRRVYRTGDLVRISTNGTLGWIGRKNSSQVKIRGQRVELAEIEETIRQHIPSSLTVAVDIFTPGNDNEKQILGAVFGTSGVVSGGSNTQVAGYTKVLTADLIPKLNGTLPHHMVPSVFIPLPSLPVMNTGKLDRKTLHSLAIPLGVQLSKGTATANGQAPKTTGEKLLFDLWSEVLGISKDKPAGRTDNFFNVGGDSIMAMRLVALA
nr:hypothetical protein FVER53263_21071 [Fusarium verticillioides]